MDGSASIMPQSPDWRYTHTASSRPSLSTTSISNLSSTHTAHTTPTDLKPHTPLPPLAHIDIANIKRDAQENHESPKHISPLTTTAPSIPSLNSPAGGYPGPPPPYSSLVTTPSTTATMGGYLGYQAHAHPVSDTRRHVEEDRLPPTQSLPSIHEALSNGSAPFHRGPAPPPPAQSQQPSSMSGISPITPIQRSHANSLSSHPPNLYESHQPPSRQIDPPTRPALEIFQKDPRAEDSRRYPYESQSAHPTHHPSESPRSTFQPQPQSQPSTPSFFNHSSTQNLPPVQPPQSYATSYPPAYSYPPPSSYPNQPQPSSTWRAEPAKPEFTRPEDEQRGLPPLSGGRKSPGPYHHGQSVKRHLETFDLELGLNELAEGSSRTLEFARKYVDKAHHMHRSGIATALPTMAECDEMYNLQRSILNSMDRIRDIVVTQQHALAEQRHREEANKARQASLTGSSNDLYDKDEGGGGFAGSDPKKRRGRHAPPGRCHSCARSETPEWRRGPDGARTLCNACGLHYAKLTRKLGSKAHLTGSNLRPKEDGPASP